MEKEYTCNYCQKQIEKPEDGVIDQVSGNYYHNAKGCPIKDKSLGDSCSEMRNGTLVERVQSHLVPLIDLVKPTD
ncbi:hypothetical protein HOE37_06215 [Candidatus Woesearchaeota archaeon]|jgi:hypothetical protein|nr:hypothetical protein [Candidatus Woesearchaeota archaeon]MBT4111425.1 hypothetical protein [Candidatus Woesearchaeota archaeon]MBT4336354.1 hypothetical protein [Candidatus Woesearchaeota archaeon]MBT4469991.1 hypothetical protein [Candidatus Woesearchaeota archaeon]MBT6744285.1 hypothetical protein [Candidatus Woesearchaeota archaeon]